MHLNQVRTGDVISDPEGKVWHKTGVEPWKWETFSGTVTYEGPWKPEYGPQGHLTLLMRDGKPYPHRAGT